MIFSTYLFIFGFLPAAFGCYALLLRFGKITAAKTLLVVASLCFYAYGAGDFFPVFLMAIVFNYIVGSSLSKLQSEHAVRKKTLFLLGIGGNLGLLGFYKYTDFAIFNFNYLFNATIPYQHILLPLGISFFIFQIIGYLVDSYRNETSNYSFLNYLLFITFFPQLIVGPIIHHKEVVPQFEEVKNNTLTFESISLGVFLFFMGCAKKLLLADPLTEWAQRAFENAQHLTSIESWVASLSYTLSYYFDLSGYADMAIGLGLMFSIAIPSNFNSPYKARNFADYWRRWHMTLSKFLGDYVFRNVYRKEKGPLNFYLALFITFLVSGFWHGAGWTFVAWGCINGAFVMAAHFMSARGWALPFVIAWFMTFIGVIATRVLFVANDFSDAFYVLKQMFYFDGKIPDASSTIAVLQPLYILVALFIVLALPNSTFFKEKFKPNVKYMFATAILILMSILNMSEVRGFLYFQF